MRLILLAPSLMYDERRRSAIMFYIMMAVLEISCSFFRDQNSLNKTNMLKRRNKKPSMRSIEFLIDTWLEQKIFRFAVSGSDIDFINRDSPDQFYPTNSSTSQVVHCSPCRIGSLQ